MPSASRSLGFVAVAVLIGALAGGFYGPRVQAGSGDSGDADVQAMLRNFTRVYQIVETEYAEKIDPDKAIYGLDVPASPVGAIPGMLRPLDPHSDFFGPHAFNQIREQEQVKYYGVGMSIVTRLDRTNKLSTYVPALVPGSPAFKAGVRPGDTIRKVDETATEGLDGNRVSSMLRGPKGTVVHVFVEREGYDQPLEFTITRDEIKNPTVDNALIVKPGIAYLHINNFFETTDDELSAALKNMNLGEIKGLILDLRGNPGGLLDQAVAVSDHFLAKGQLIVYQNGRVMPEQRYNAMHGNRGQEYPMVVLVNRYTASAAEIVTGALQDHDRALVIGEPSFGKGLVQSVYALSEHAGLALTTAHYYTPSGRLIQRDYSEVSPYDYFYHAEGGQSPRIEVRRTDGGREVYGGGGITPDIEVAPTALTAVQQDLADHDAIYGFTQHYLGVHKTIARDFEVTPEVVNDFNQYLTDHHFHVTPDDVQDNIDYIKAQVRDQLVEDVYGRDQELKLEAQNDPLVAKAVDSMPQAAALLVHAKQILASRRQESAAE
ncbi:MAG TPA: S41 family peptidase [Terriglobia bacterium]|nr:S41 family peptidase [Terriglobia bacterium]